MLGFLLRMSASARIRKVRQLQAQRAALIQRHLMLQQQYLTLLHERIQQIEQQVQNK